MRSGLFIIAAIAAIVSYSSLYYFLGPRYRHFAWQHGYYCTQYYDHRYNAPYQDHQRPSTAAPYRSDSSHK